MKRLFAACFLAGFSVSIASTAYAASPLASSQSTAAKTFLTRGEGSMRTTIERAKSALASFPLGACVDLLERVNVELNGKMTPLSRLADVSTPDAKSIEIRPGDTAQLSSIAKAIVNSNIGLTPANDGKIIRISLPTMTKERRMEMIRLVSKVAEGYRTEVRDHRRQIREAMLRSEKEKMLTEEERKRAEEELDTLTDDYMKKIDEMLDAKEKEIMDV